MTVLYNLGALVVLLVFFLVAVLLTIFLCSCASITFNGSYSKAPIKVPEWLACLIFFSTILTLFGFGIYGIITNQVLLETK